MLHRRANYSSYRPLSEPAEIPTPSFRRRIRQKIPYFVRAAGFPVLRIEFHIDLNIRIDRSSPQGQS